MDLFIKKKLKNGLQIVFHPSAGDIACVDVAYGVGSKNEESSKTGLAHFSEHMMFCGSQNVKDYDFHMQSIGGVNNAYTNHDYTNYYCLFPKENIETALWLESNRMVGMDFPTSAFEAQKKLVIEEFKETQSNKPYGNIYSKLLELAYKKHSYRWAVIGKEESHIENFTEDDVKNFFSKYYSSKNATLIISGNFDKNYIFDLAEKWFSDIEQREVDKKIISEPIQKDYREAKIEGEAPFDAVYRGYKMSPRISENFYTFEVLSRIFGEGKSSRLYKKLVDEEKVFNSIDTFLTESADAGLFIIGGTVSPDFSVEKANEKIEEVLSDFILKGIEKKELEKIKNIYETENAFDLCSLSNRVDNLAMFFALDGEKYINKDSFYINNISEESVLSCARETFIPENCSTVFFHHK